MSITRYDPELDADACNLMAVVPLGEYVLHVDYANDLAEARQDYANLASTSGDMLKLAVARAEKAEAVVELARQFMACVDTMEETYAGKRPWKNIQVVMRLNAECLAAKEAMCVAIRKNVTV